jgi:AP-1 complex subunit mu
MTISAIFVLDSKGKIILSRDYRGDVSATQCLPRFVQRVFESDDTNNLTPIFEIDGVNYIYVKCNNVYRSCRQNISQHKIDSPALS